MSRTFVPYLVALALLVGATGASAQERVFSFERYHELEAAMLAADERRVADELSPADRVDATGDAIAARRELAAYLEDWLQSGQLDDDTAAYASNARLVLLENLVHLSVEHDDCAGARHAFDTFADGVQGADAELVALLGPAAETVDACEAREAEALAQSDPPVPSDALGADPGEPRHRFPHNRAALALIGAGSAAVVGASAWNFSLLDDRNTHRDLNGCGGACAQRVIDSADRIDRAKVPIALLFSAGVAAIGAGAVVIVLDKGDEEPGDIALRVAPNWIGLEVRGSSVFR